MSDNYIVVSVPSIIERDKVIKRMYANLTKELSRDLTIAQDQVNRIRVYHNLNGGMKQLIRTYLVIVIPIIIDLNPLYSICGTVHFELSETIKNLESLTKKLQALQGSRVMKGNTTSESTFRQLVAGLSSTNGKY